MSLRNRAKFNKDNREQVGEEEQSITPVKLSDIQYYLSEDYESYFVEYVGNIKETIDKLDYADVYLPGKFFAVVFVKKGMINNLLQDVPEIFNVKTNFPYTLSELQVVNEVNDPMAINKGNVSLQGNDVVVGIISTGIDYLNPRFMSEQGETRIEAIWDQSIKEGYPPQGFVQGREFRRASIDEAIRNRNEGRNPYEIVPHRDEVGHGTALAGIIGGRILSEDEEFKSIVPNCTYAIVKINKAKQVAKEAVGIENTKVDVYQGIDVTSAIRYLSELQLSLKKPMVIYVPVGSNQGGHDGLTVAEKYIDLFSQRKDLIFVGNSGNQGNSDTHATGNITEAGSPGVVRLNIGKNQEKIFFSAYTSSVDRISFTIKSPTGEVSEKISIPENNQYLSFSLGETLIQIRFFEQRGEIGEEVTEILFSNAKEGIWEFDFIAEFVAYGRYDIWLQQKELLQNNTRFLDPNQYTTIMLPTTANNIITAAGYNQQTNAILPQSGRGFTRDGRIKPAVTCPAVNVLTTGLNNNLIVVSGMAVAGAFLAGAAALLLQWGIVDKNITDLSPQRPRNIMISSTLKKEEVSYPNPEWGYGVISIEKMFENLEKFPRTNESLEEGAIFSRNKDSWSYDVKDLEKIDKRENTAERFTAKVYINIPKEVRDRLKFNKILKR
ncbi:S8 family peptidase [Clostridium sp.]|uniref:S8 family peptidase n=1 Tax=Clostridium sp. TaxID=1506 RepID=UPI002FCBA547